MSLFLQGKQLIVFVAHLKFDLSNKIENFYKLESTCVNFIVFQYLEDFPNDMRDFNEGDFKKYCLMKYANIICITH